MRHTSKDSHGEGRTRSLACLLAGLAMLGCGSGGGGGPDGGGGGPDGGGGGADAAPAHLDKAACGAVAASFVQAATDCGTSLPAGAQATAQGWCEKGVDHAAMCGGDPAGGLDCFGSPDPTDWVCQLGAPYPSCGGDLAAALGMFCVISMGNPACASGIHCEYDVDCGDHGSCNSVTSQCFDDHAYCVGLPCGYDVDCPSGETCNSAEHACIHG